MDAYLPAISRALLGEDLKIPDISTVWCGTEWGRKEALARLAGCILRDAFDARPLFSRHSSARLGMDLHGGGARARAATSCAIAARPWCCRKFRRWAWRRSSRMAHFAAKPVSLARLRRLDAQRLDGDAGRADPRRRRRHGARAVHAVGRFHPRMPGCCPRRRWTVSACSPTAARRWKSSARANPRPAAPWTICSGWAAMPSAPKVLCASCAPWRRASATRPASALEVARKLLIPFSQASDAPIEEIATEAEPWCRNCSY